MKQKSKKAKVKTLFSPTAITQHLRDRMLNACGTHRQKMYEAPPTAARRALNAKLKILDKESDRLTKLERTSDTRRHLTVQKITEKAIDDLILGKTPADMSSVNALKAKLATI